MASSARKTRWGLLAAAVALSGAGIAVWQFAIRPSLGGAGVPANAIMVIAPYWYNGTWVFDDPAAHIADLKAMSLSLASWPGAVSLRPLVRSRRHTA